MTNDRIAEFVARSTAETEALLETLGAIPAPTGQEDERAAFVCDWLRREGLPARIDAAKNVLCMLNCEDQPEMTAFLAHTDVVFPDTEPLPVVRDGSILRAPGIGDDTANLVHLLLGARYLSENCSRLTRSVLIAANAGEEGLGNLSGCRAVFDSYGDRIRYFYSFDCGFGDVVCDAVGSHRFRVTVRAQGGHSWTDFGRENAIHTAARLICALYAIPPYPDARTTFNAGTIQGGSTVNSIAETAEFLYEYRSVSEAGLAYMKEAFDAVLKDFRSKGCTIDTELLGIRPGTGDLDRTSFDAWTERNLSLLRPFAGDSLRLRAASTDANIPLSRGVFANTIGTVVTDGAHTRGEWADLASIPAGLSMVLILMEECLS